MRAVRRKTLRLRGGFPTRGPTLDALRSRDDEVPDDDIVEIHNYVPEAEAHEVNGGNIAPDHDGRDDEGESGELGRFPPGSHAETDDETGEVVVYGQSAQRLSARSDRHDTGARDGYARPPRTLAELNRFFAEHYTRRRAAR